MRDAITKISILLDHLRDTYESWKRTIWKRDLDEQYCCNGQMCGCHGATVRDVYCMRAADQSGDRDG